MSQLQQPSPSERVKSAASRLRALQSSCVHLEGLAREKHLEEELNYLLKEVPESEQNEYLTELRSHFPCEAKKSDLDQSFSISSKTELLTQLDNELANANSQERVELLSKIEDLQNRYGEQIAKSDSRHPLEKIFVYDDQKLAHLRLILTVLSREKLNLDSQKPFDLVNCIRLLALFTDHFPKLHEIFGKIWEGSGESLGDQKEDEDLRQQLASYLLGDQSVAGSDLATKVEESSQLMAAFLSAVPDTVRELAREIMQEIAPESITTIVRQKERSSLGMESKYWKEFEYRCQDFTEDKLVEKLISILTKKTRSFIG